MIYLLELKGGGTKEIPVEPFHAWLKKQGVTASSNFRVRAEQLSKFTGLQVKDWTMEEDGGAGKANDSARRAKLHRALDALLDRKAKDVRRVSRQEAEECVYMAIEQLRGRPIDAHTVEAQVAGIASDYAAAMRVNADDLYDAAVRVIHDMLKKHTKDALGTNRDYSESAKDAIQHVAVEPVTGSFQTRVKHGENTAQRAGFQSPKKAQRWGESTLAKLAKQSAAPPKFRSWKIGEQPSTQGVCPACRQMLALVDGKVVPHTRPWLYGVQKNFKVDPDNKRYQCKGSGQEPKVAAVTDARARDIEGRWEQKGGKWYLRYKGQFTTETHGIVTPKKDGSALASWGTKDYTQKFSSVEAAKSFVQRDLAEIRWSDEPNEAKDASDSPAPIQAKDMKQQEHSKPELYKGWKLSIGSYGILAEKKGERSFTARSYAEAKEKIDSQPSTAKDAVKIKDPGNVGTPAGRAHHYVRENVAARKALAAKKPLPGFKDLTETRQYVQTTASKAEKAAREGKFDVDEIYRQYE